MLNINSKKNIALNASIIAICIASTASVSFAQENQNTTEAFTPSGKVVSATNKAEETVIVTATGRAKAIQDIPVAVTAVSALTIQQAGITDVRNLQQVTPSYKVQTGQSNGSSAQIQIRGIGTGSDNPGYEGAVAVFVDGVYRNRSGAALSDLPKVDRIEVLRGPQGTLFGRNTSAGAVSIVTSAPKFERNTYGKMEFGNLGYSNVSFGQTDTLFDGTAYRLEFGGQVRDGLIHEVNTGGDINNRNRYYVRAQTLTKINNDATFRLILDANKTDEVCCSAVRVRSGPLGTPQAALGNVSLLDYIAGLRGWDGFPPINEKAAQVANTPGRPLTEKIDDKGISGELNWNTSIGKFTSITAYRKWDLFRQQDVDFSGLDRAYRDGYKLHFDTFTQEFRLNGQKGPLDWLVGAFFMNEKTEFDDSIKFGVDAGRYVDGLVKGVSVPWNTANGAVNPCTGGNFLVAPGSTVFNSLGAGTSAFSQALCPTILSSVVSGASAQVFAQAKQGGASDAQATAAAQAYVGANFAALRGTAQTVANVYGSALAAAAPTNGEGQQKEHSDVDTNSWAIFTHNVYEFTPSDKVTVGLRYNVDKKDVSSSLNATSKACSVMQSTASIGGLTTFKQLTAGLLAAANADPSLSNVKDLLSAICHPAVNVSANGNYNGTDKEEALNGIFSYAHNFSDDLMVYGTYSRGYKSGGFNYDRMALNINPAGTTTPSVEDWRVKPEYTDNLELGWKWSNLLGRTTFNGAIFNETISDYQMNAWTGFSFRSFNVDKMVSRGVELEVSSRPVTGLTLNGGMLYNDAYYDSDAILPNSTEVVIKKGSQLATAPKWTFTGSINYRQPIEGTSLAWSFYLDGLYNTKQGIQTLGQNPYTSQDAYALFNTRVGIGSAEGTWALEAWVKNLTDELYHQYALGIPEQSGEYAVYKSDPRTFGLTIRASF